MKFIWCRYCGVRSTSRWRPGPASWSNSGKLCNAHWQAWKNERISLPEEEPTSPINGIRRGERENCYIREASANDGFIECKVPAFGGVLSFPTRVLLPGQIDLSSVTEKSVSIFPCSASPKQDTQRAQREFAKLLVVGKQFDPSSVNIFTRSAYQDTQHAKRERVKQKIRRALQRAFQCDHYCRPCNCLGTKKTCARAQKPFPLKNSKRGSQSHTGVKDNFIIWHLHPGYHMACTDYMATSEASMRVFVVARTGLDSGIIIPTVAKLLPPYDRQQIASSTRPGPLVFPRRIVAAAAWQSPNVRRRAAVGSTHTPSTVRRAVSPCAVPHPGSRGPTISWSTRIARCPTSFHAFSVTKNSGR